MKNYLFWFVIGFFLVLATILLTGESVYIHRQRQEREQRQRKIEEDYSKILPRDTVPDGVLEWVNLDSGYFDSPEWPGYLDTSAYGKVLDSVMILRKNKLLVDTGYWQTEPLDSEALSKFHIY